MASNVKWQQVSQARKKLFSLCRVRHSFNSVVLQAVFNIGFAIHLTAPNIYRGSARQQFICDQTTNMVRLLSRRPQKILRTLLPDNQAAGSVSPNAPSSYSKSRGRGSTDPPGIPEDVHPYLLHRTLCINKERVRRPIKRCELSRAVLSYPVALMICGAVIVASTGQKALPSLVVLSYTSGSPAPLPLCFFRCHMALQKHLYVKRISSPEHIIHGNT